MQLSSTLCCVRSLLCARGGTNELGWMRSAGAGGRFFLLLFFFFLFFFLFFFFTKKNFRPLAWRLA